MAKRILLLILLFVYYYADAQAIDQLLAKAKQLGANETVYLHTDKTSFLPGETVWFNAFARAGKVMVADNSILVVNLIASSSRLIESKKILLQSGVAASYFVLPVTDSNQYYSLQAYTTGMLSLDSANIYSKTIFLKNSCNQYDIITDPVDPIQFFAEGNAVVDGFSTTIAFKMPTAENLSEIVNGIVEDEKGMETVSFNSMYQGMGKFEITPEEGKSYFAVFSVNGKKKKLPLFLKKATNNSLLNIYPVADGFVYRIRSRQMGKYRFIVEANYDIKYQSIVDINTIQGFAKFLPDSILAPGINHMVLLDDNNNVLAQRLYYNCFEKGKNPVNVVIDDTLTGKGEVVVHIDNMKKGHYSIAVTNVLSTPLNETDNIVLNGKISPLVTKPLALNAIQLVKDDSLRKLYFDLLMLTNTSTRYDMESIKKIFNNKMIDDGDVIKTLGLLTDADKKNRVLGNEELTIFIKQGDTLKGVIQTASDKNGLVKLPNMILEDTATVYFRQLKDRYPKFTLKITPPSFDQIIKKEFDFLIKPCGNLSVNSSSEISQINIWNKESEVKMMQGITLTSIKKTNRQLIEEKYVSPWFTSLSNERGDFDFINDYTNMGSGTILNFLNNRVMINGSGDVSGYNLILNESVVDVGIMNGVNLSDVAYIKVMGSNFIPPVSPYIPGAPTLIVYTKKGDDNVSGTMGVFKMKMTGYATNKAYFNPVFDKGILPAANRGTLYWNNALKTDKANTKYYKLMNTTAKDIRVIIQGVDENGNAVYVSKEVKITN